MSDPHEPQAADVEPIPASPTEMRLRSDRAPVTRLSRKVLLGLTGLAVAGIAATLVFALRPHGSTGHSELYNTANRSTPDGLTALLRAMQIFPSRLPSWAHRSPAIWASPCSMPA